MDSERINSNQYMNLMVFFMLGGSVLLKSGASAGSDVWILYSVNWVVGLVFFAMFYRLSRLHDYRSFPLIFERCLGKWGGKLLCFFYLSYFLLRFRLIGDTMTEMASDLLMNGSPNRMTMLVLLFAVLYGCSKGLRALGRSAELLLPLTLVCLLPFFITAFVSDVFTLQNLRPILTGGTTDFWKKFASMTIYPYSELIFFAMLIVNMNHKDQKGAYRKFVYASLFATLLLIGISTTNLAILGRHLAASFKYPFYNAMMMTGVHGVLERLDPLAVIIIIVCGFYKVSLYAYGFINFLQSFFPLLKKKWIIPAIGVIIFSFGPGVSFFNDKLINETVPFRIMVWFHIAIPLVLWIITEIKRWQQQKKDVERISKTLP